MFRVLTAHLQRFVRTLSEDLRERRPDAQRPPRDEQLEPAVAPVDEQLAGRAGTRRGIVPSRLQLREASLAKREVDGAPVVRVHQREIGQFGSLVEVRDSRRGD